MSNAPQFETDPKRFEYGCWCHTKNRQIGEGDISASYSADRIGQGQSVRKPFRHEGGDWVATSNCNGTAKAYRLVHPSCFQGESMTYAERVSHSHETKTRPLEGFYHGMRVKHGREDMVLCGPEAQFFAGEPEQGSLF